jgi:outer membrane protein TolC
MSSVEAPFTRAGLGQLSDVFDWRSFTMAVGPTIQWPILNYGILTNAVRAKDAQFQQALLSYRNTVLTAAQQVEDALVSFLQYQDQVKSYTEGVEALRRAAYLATVEYREGAATYTRVLDTQKNLQQDLDNLAQARGQVPASLIALYTALGGGWQIREGKDFVPREIIETMRKRTNWGDLLPPGDLPENLEAPGPIGPLDLPRKPDW